MQKTSKVTKQGVVKFLVEHKQNSNRFQITAFHAFHAVVSQLLAALGLPENVKKDDLKLAFLNLDEFVPVYDARNNTIIELLYVFVNWTTYCMHSTEKRLVLVWV